MLIRVAFDLSNLAQYKEAAKGGVCCYPLAVMCFPSEEPKERVILSEQSESKDLRTERLLSGQTVGKRKNAAHGAAELLARFAYANELLAGFAYANSC